MVPQEFNLLGGEAKHKVVGEAIMVAPDRPGKRLGGDPVKKGQSLSLFRLTHPLQLRPR